MPDFREKFSIARPAFAGKARCRSASPLLLGIVLYLIAFYMISMPASSEPEAFTASYWLQKGDEFFAGNSFELAAECYDKAIGIDSGSFLAWNNKGRSLFEMGLFEDADDAFSRALEINLASSDAWNNKGRALFELGKYQESYDAQRRALEIDPQNAAAWYGEGRALEGLKIYYGSSEAYGRALEIDPENADAWYRKGRVFYNLSLYSKSNQALDKALELEPLNEEAWRYKGLALAGLGRPDESEKALGKSIEIYFLDADAWTTKGDDLSELGRGEESEYAYKEADKIYNKIISLRSNADAWYKKGELLFKFYDYYGSQDAFRNAFDQYSYTNNYKQCAEILFKLSENYYTYSPIYINGTNYNYYNHSDLLTLHNDLHFLYKVSLNIYNETLAVDPGNAYAWYEKGLVLDRMDEYNGSKAAYSRSVEIYDRLLRIDPQNASLWVKKGDSLIELADENGSELAYAEAIQIYNDILNSDPHNPIAYCDLGKVLYKLNRYQESDEMYSEALMMRKKVIFRYSKNELTSNNSAASFWIEKGDFYSKNEKYNLAFRCYDKAIEADPNSSLAWNNKGLALYEFKWENGILLESRLKESIACYDQALKIDPLYAESWYNRGVVLRYQDRDDEAQESFNRAAEIDPSNYDTPSYSDDSTSLSLSQMLSRIGDEEKSTELGRFLLSYLPAILIFIIIFRIKRVPREDKILNRIKKYILKFNFYIPLRIALLVKFITLLIIPFMSVMLVNSPSELLIRIVLIYLIVLSVIGIGAIISFILWVFFSSPLNPCGYRAIWADLEQQMKYGVILSKLCHIAIVYAFISGIITAMCLIYNEYQLAESFITSWILVASLSTIIPSVIGIMLSMNLDRQTARSVLISQFGLIGINGFWLSIILSSLVKYIPSLRVLTGDFSLLIIIMMIPFYIVFLIIPYLQGLRRAARQREELYAKRQSWLDRLSDILEVPTPDLYFSELEKFLKDFDAGMVAFIENDDMVKLGSIWDENKDSLEYENKIGKFSYQIMKEAYKKSRNLDPRFLQLDFLVDLRIHVSECIRQLDIAGKKGEARLIRAASNYSTVYHSMKDEITETIEQDRKMKPNWTVAIATIITLILTPILNELGKLISGMIPR